MHNRLLIMLLLAAALLLLFLFLPEPADGSTGAVKVTAYGDTKIMIQKDADCYFYSMGKSTEYFPLQMGEGLYTVHILKYTGKGNQYLVKDELAVEVDNPDAYTLASVQNIPWQESLFAMGLAEELTKDTLTDEESLKAIHGWIRNNIVYDTQAKMQRGYIPDPDITLQTGTGVCYNYASLLASMLRSVGIPTKLMMGYADTYREYHAWNEVYIDGKWKVVDVTFDASVEDAYIYKIPRAYRAIKHY